MGVAAQCKRFGFGGGEVGGRNSRQPTTLDVSRNRKTAQNLGMSKLYRFSPTDFDLAVPNIAAYSFLAQYRW